MTDHIAKCSQTLSSRFEEFAKTGKPAEVKELSRNCFSVRVANLPIRVTFQSNVCQLIS